MRDEDRNFSDELLAALKNELGVTWDAPSGILGAAQAAFIFRSHLISPTSRVMARELKDKYKDINETTQLLKTKIAGLPAREINLLTARLWGELLEPIQDELYVRNFDRNVTWDEPTVDFGKLHEEMNVIDILDQVSHFTKMDDGIVKEGKYREFISNFCYQYARLKCHHQSKGTSFMDIRGNLDGGREAAKKRIENNRALILKISSYVISYDVVKDGGISIEDVGRGLRYSFKGIFEEACEKALNVFWGD